MRRGMNRAVGQPCPCGRKAVTWKSGWVCQRCLEIEERHARREAIRHSRAGYEFNQVAEIYRVHVVPLTD